MRGVILLALPAADRTLGHLMSSAVQSLRADPTPVEAAKQRRHGGGLVFLDSSLAQENSLSVIANEPVEILTGRFPDDVPKIRSVMQKHATHSAVDLGAPTGGLFGWVGFGGDYVFGVFPQCHVFQHKAASWIGRVPPVVSGPIDHVSAATSLKFKALMGKRDFMRRAVRAQEYITAGDIYQVNLSYPWQAKWPAKLEAFEFYERLRSASPAPHAAFLDLAGTQVFSASPECFLHMSGRQIITRPIKGTRPRGANAQNDRDLADELQRSTKERAELVMITDLERNDLGQVCEYGSVRVTGLLKLERFAQVHHLVSTIEGTLRADVDHLGALIACFPGGSITGAPKMRALEIIRELEPHPRDLYTGAIGFLGFNGESRFNIAIRTAWLRDGMAQFHTGAGIVADSSPAMEYEETLHKAAGLLQAARSRTQKNPQ